MEDRGGELASRVLSSWAFFNEINYELLPLKNILFIV